MEKTILIGGQAGQGTAVTSHLIGKIFCRLGYFVFNYRDYPSLIRGGHNFNILRISDRPVYSHSEKYDFILAFDQKTIDLHQKNLALGGVIFGDKKSTPTPKGRGKKMIAFDLDAILAKIGGPKILENDILIGAIFKYFGAPEKILLEEIEKQFPEKNELIKKSIKEGYALIKEKEILKVLRPAKYFLSGTEGVGAGALFSGIDAYLAYPMTPATPVLNFLMKKKKKHNFFASQIEDETAVINTALGASFAGAKTMIGTSGGGFALMTEALSLAGGAEIPIVIYLGQRTGPSTGVPTYTGQGDLKFALSAGHGEFPRVVVAPGDPKEAIARTQEAFYLSLKYRLPVILISDKHLAESDYSFDKLESSSLPNNRFILEALPANYQSYKITLNGVSPRAVPGQGQVVRVNSYEHDQDGLTAEDSVWIKKMNEKRLKKIPYLTKEINKLEPVRVFGRGPNLIISWGSAKGAIIDSLPRLKNYRFLQISYISPFPKEQVLKEIKRAKKVVLVENNLTGLLGDVIAEQTGFIIKDKVLRYDGRPFTSEYIIHEIRFPKH